MDARVLLRLLPDLDELPLAVVARAVGLHFAHGPEGEMGENLSHKSANITCPYVLVHVPQLFPHQPQPPQRLFALSHPIPIK